MVLKPYIAQTVPDRAACFNANWPNEGTETARQNDPARPREASGTIDPIRILKMTTTCITQKLHRASATIDPMRVLKRNIVADFDNLILSFSDNRPYKGSEICKNSKPSRTSRKL